MIVGKLRRIGESMVVTIPHEEVDRLGLAEGDTVSIEARKVTLVPHHELRPELEAIAVRLEARPDFQRALDYLKDR